MIITVTRVVCTATISISEQASALVTDEPQLTGFEFDEADQVLRLADDLFAALPSLSHQREED